jgi:hypothetical protein
MKFASVLAAAAAATLALTATAASAGPAVYRGAATGSINTGVPFLGTISGTVRTGDSVSVPFVGNVNYGTSVIQGLDALNLGINSNIALFTMDSAGFAGNTAATTLSNGATFSLTGNVTPDCAYYTGGTDTTVDFGQIGINTSDNNPNGAFEMVSSDRTLDISSNLAGCNTKNTVTFVKHDLTNTSQAGFDAAQFTNVIPVELSASFTAGVPGATGNAGLQTVSLTQGGSQAAANTYGAWKSPMNMQVKMKNPGLGLLSGTYNGSVSVTIAVAN